MPCGSVFRLLRKSFKPRNKSATSPDVENSADVIQVTKKRSAKEGATTFELLPTPVSAVKRNEYTVIRLSNGVVATIIADGQEKKKVSSTNQSKESIVNELKPPPTAAPQRGGEWKQVQSETTLRVPNAAPDTNRASAHSHEKEDKLEMDVNSAPKQALAACSVTVDVGSFNDPENIPGLCHLVEHVLSMGSDKFEGEDVFEAFLGQTGGSYNAETETEYTSFYFECPDTVLYAAMEMFSRFFVEPLMRVDSVRRERLAVASEFAEQSNSDNARRMQIICTCANSNNPAKKFAWGSLETLNNNITVAQLQKTMKEFTYTYFTADRVKVAVQAQLPSKTLANWVNILFSDIPIVRPNPGHQVAVIRPPDNLFDNMKFCRLYKVQSVGDICDVNMNWVLPPIETKYKTKPLEYISYVIGAEGEGSLISCLRSQQMAFYLTSEVEDGGLASNSLYTIFTICVSLTEEGRHKVKEVIKTVFGYLKMLCIKGPSELIWLELQEIAEISFRYNRAHRPAENVRLISQGMRVFPPEDYLTGWTKFSEFNGEEIQKYLSIMTPSNANILLQMKKHDVILSEEEKWFKTKYRSDKIPSEWIHEWNTAEPEISFHLPPENPYIAHDFSLLGKGDQEESRHRIIDTQQYKAWYKRDHFNKPYTTVNILLGTPHENQTVQNTVCQMLFAKMFVYQMIDKLYFAHVAHIEYKMTSTEYGLEISIHGISQKLPVILREVALGLRQFKGIEPAHSYLLKSLKEVLKRNIVNTLSNGASLMDDTRESITSTLRFACGEKYPYITTTTHEEVDKYWHGMLGNTNAVALVQGNISAAKAKEMVEEFFNILKTRSKHHITAQPLARVIPLGESVICIAPFHPQEENCYTQYYYQFGHGSIMESVALQLFVATMRETLFDELRTKEQLGYSVSITFSERLGVIGVIITVHSQINRHSNEYIRARIDTFVQHYLKHFRMISRVEFGDIKKAFIAMKQQTLAEESSRNWWDMNNCGGIDKSKEIAALQRLQKNWMVEVVARTVGFSKYSNAARKLVIQVVGFKSDTDVGIERKSEIIGSTVLYRSVVTETLTSTSNVVNDVLAWKYSLPLYLKQ